jgi:hypothetical protein
MSGNTNQLDFDAAIKAWIAKHFLSDWKPSLAMVKSQLIERYKIDNVNRLREVDEKGGLELLVSEYFAALNEALANISADKLKGGSEGV